MKYTKEIREEIERLEDLNERGILSEVGKKSLKKLLKTKRKFKHNNLPDPDISVNFLFNFVNEFTTEKVTLKEIKEKLKDYNNGGEN